MGSRKVVIHYYLHSGASDNKTRYDKTRIKNLSRGNDAPRRNNNCQAMEGYIMTDTKHNMPKLDKEVATNISNYSHNKVTGDKLEHSMVATMQAAGFVWTDCISPKSAGSTATEETFTFLKDAIAAGFPKGVQELCNMTSKAAGDKQVDGRNRSYWSRQPNSIVAAIGRALKIKEEIDAEIASGKAGKDTKTRTPEMMVRDALADCVKRIKNAETFEFDHKDMTLDELIGSLNMFIKHIG